MNEKQLEAVKSLENTLVVAGAGSGKTFTIVNKIKYLLDNNIYKENELLIISFTNESVNDLKRKIDYDLDILTFHKLAITLINNPDMKISNEYYLKYIINEYFNSYGKYNKKQNKLIKRILQEMDIDNLKKLIFTFINLYKSNYNDINYLLNLYQKSHFINKIYFKIILEIYHIYNQEIESSNLYDFNDMIKIATNNINNNIIKTNYKYIIIDEFQDTSLNRFKLIDAIMKQNNAKIFVVGDDYQSIYRFSGCNLDIFLNFNKLVSNLNIINLDYNYRNPKEIIDVANSFIMKNKKQIKKETICLKNINKPIKICFYKNKRTAIEKILKYIDTKYLILGRNNKDKDLFNVQDKPFLTIHKSKGLEEDKQRKFRQKYRVEKLTPEEIKTISTEEFIKAKKEYIESLEEVK